MLVVPVASDLYARSNKALDINPPTGTDIHITTHGSNWYWAGFAAFSLTFILLIALSYSRKRVDRFFYYTSTCSVFFMAIAYYTMASNLGWTGIQAQYNHVNVSPTSVTPGIRQIFYARYIGWFLAFPTLLINLAVFSGLTWPTTLFIVVCQEIFVVALLIGALIRSSYKWGYYVFALVAMLLVVYNCLYTMPLAAVETASVTNNNYRLPILIFSLGFSLLLMLYPICWGLSEGGNVIQPDSEAAFYGVLDVLLFIFWIAGFTFFVAKIDLNSLGIHTSTRPVFHDEKYWHEHEARDSQHGLGGRPSDATAVSPNTGRMTDQYSGPDPALQNPPNSANMGSTRYNNEPAYAQPVAPPQTTAIA
ncbi:family A G protein-coupled receptor-like protein [Nadsonia fulvescens var. elongata DSM 6958]|uniref:Family A G protein-coupled receptor-like protein n=1 Tax=Nadsonia fulvescens var. elongata DSM 6958 TaxID=857566 RepID=A0A1E3PSH2_9ASCO|nr:family A G protein-coupled receptor-like protein [Nadsonia fulvescens var. elongata DSM 6958]